MTRCQLWHAKESKRLKELNGIYDLRKEMLKYCYDDCFVLSMAFTRFNESMITELKNSGVQGIVDHQFTISADFITLPQMVIHWFVGSIMSEKTLSIVPHRGYDNGKCGSLKENIWLAFLDKKNEEIEGFSFVPIESRYCNKRQKRIGRYFLDGFRKLQDGSRECYEFYGCYYHGCFQCFPDRNKIVRHKYREEIMKMNLFNIWM